jgi:hypothetical protein
VSFLRINGVIAPVKADSANERAQLIEDVARMEDTSLFIDRRGEKGVWRVVLILRGESVDNQAEYWRKFIHGEGQYMSFDANLYSSKGLGPSVVTNSVQSAGGFWLGAGKVTQTAGSGVLTYPALRPNSTTGWTVMVARKLGAGVFQHFVVNSLGEEFVNGVFGIVGTTWLVVNTTTGTVTLNADAAQSTVIDELVVYPYIVPFNWIQQLYNFQNPVSGNKQIGSMRTIKIDGRLIDDGGPRNVIGRVTGSELRHRRRQSVFLPYRTMTVEFEEV